MSRGELTDEAIERVKKTLIDAQSDNPHTRRTAMMEIKKLTVLYGADALSGVEDTLAEEAWNRSQEEAIGMGGAGIVWD